MPFKPSSHEDFEAVNAHGIEDYRINGTFESQAADPVDGAAFRTAMRDAFVAYEARSDIESRDSILAREQAQPGSIFWAAQTVQGEVDVVTDPTPEGP